MDDKNGTEEAVGIEAVHVVAAGSASMQDDGTVHVPVERLTARRTQGGAIATRAPKLTQSMKRTAKYKRDIAEQHAIRYRKEFKVRKPRTWGECEAAGLGQKGAPCPFLSCKYNLLVDVSPAGGLVIRTAPGFGAAGASTEAGVLPASIDCIEDVDLPEDRCTCALAAVAAEPTLEDVGEMMNLTRERVRQIESRAIAKATTLPGMKPAEREKLVAQIKDGIEEPPRKPGTPWVQVSPVRIAPRARPLY
jgi:hypothetical protein